MHFTRVGFIDSMMAASLASAQVSEVGDTLPEQRQCRSNRDKFNNQELTHEEIRRANYNALVHNSSGAIWSVRQLVRFDLAEGGSVPRGTGLNP
jgi:hypothetical protein